MIGAVRAVRTARGGPPPGPDEGEASPTPCDAGGRARLGPYLARPARAPALDPSFRPVGLARRRFEAAARAAGDAVPASLAVEQPRGAVAVRRAVVLPDGHPDAPAGWALFERLAKTLLWAHGGTRVWVDGPPGLVAALRAHYARSGTGRFDAATVGQAVFGEPLRVIAAPAASFPADRASGSRLGGHLEGCRIGFDLGASARRAAAVVEGRVVHAHEVGWDPAGHADPDWHRAQIMDSLRRAGEHLPRVDAIGGSAAGIYVDGRVRLASIFRGVPQDQFRARVSPLFDEIRAAWGGVPLVVINDGEVAALAGALRAGSGRLLGMAMGSSLAAGYVAADGTLGPWLGELAFAPLDLAPDAPTDDWSGDRGCGVDYLSQRAVARLLPRAGVDADPDAPLPRLLATLRRLLAGGDPRAGAVYDTLGAYLGYALLEHRALYDMRQVMLLGGVVAGPGGDIIRSAAREVLRAEDPGAEDLALHVMSDRAQRHAQAVAAASLPELR